MTLRDGQNGILVHCHAGCDPLDILAELRHRGLLDDREPSRPILKSAQVAPKSIPAAARWSSRAESIWRGTQPLDPGRVPYLRMRGCAYPTGTDVRFAPALEHWPTKTTWPAIVSRITDFATGEPMSLHFTFLGEHNTAKAAVEPAKLLLGGHAKAGGVVRLSDDADVTTHLGIAEGIETALAITAGLGSRSDWLPVWAAVDAGNLAGLPVVPAIERLTIFADLDPKKLKTLRDGRQVEVGEAGQKAARTLAQRWHDAGREVFLAEPPAPVGAKADWNGA
jgi:hypothetical protein